MRTQNILRSYKTGIIVLALLFSFLLPVSAFAAGNVNYDGHSKGFIFKPGSEDSPTDLFPDFQDVVPGDTFKDTVVVKNNSAEKKTAKIYLRALGAEKGSEDFLSELNLKVSKNGQALFDATAEKKAGLTDWVLLGEFAPGESATLDVTLEVPITMGNEYQDAIGQFTWEFKAEEEEKKTGGQGGSDTPQTTSQATPATTPTPVTPAGAPASGTQGTGDESKMMLWLAILMAALLGLAGAKVFYGKQMR